jgi:hypothetical protein
MWLFALWPGWHDRTGTLAHGTKMQRVENRGWYFSLQSRLAPADHRCRGYSARSMPTSTRANSPSALQIWNQLILGLNVGVRSKLALARSESSLVPMRSQSDSDILTEFHLVCEWHWRWSSFRRILPRTAKGTDARDAGLDLPASRELTACGHGAGKGQVKRVSRTNAEREL